MTQQATVVRKMTANDFDDVYALYKELVGEIDVLGKEAGAARFTEILSHTGTSIFGVELDGQVVSVATLHVMPNLTFGGRPYALVENVVTLKQHQGRGIGTLVMQSAIEEAWSTNAYKIMLLTGQSLGARGFYEKLGFVADQKHGMILRRAPQRKPIV